MRKPKIEMYWSTVHDDKWLYAYVVNWRLVGGNGEIMCQSTQGFRDKTDAMRSINEVVRTLAGGYDPVLNDWVKITGPGRKPKNDC